MNWYLYDKKLSAVDEVEGVGEGYEKFDVCKQWKSGSDMPKFCQRSLWMVLKNEITTLFETL